MGPLQVQHPSALSLPIYSVVRGLLVSPWFRRGLPKPAEPSMRGPRCLALREGWRRDVLTTWDQSPA